MKGQMNIYYDEEGDYLDIFVGNPSPNYGEEIGDGITLFKDENTNEIVGIGILGFKKKTNLQDLKLNLPVNIALSDIKI